MLLARTQTLHSLLNMDDYGITPGDEAHEYQLSELTAEAMSLLTLAALHDNIVRLRGVTMDGGRLRYLVFDLATEGSLVRFVDSERVRRGGPLPVREVLWVMEDTLAGLRFLHTGGRRPMMHRDLKPANMFVTLRDARSRDRDRDGRFFKVMIGACGVRELQGRGNCRFPVSSPLRVFLASTVCWLHRRLGNRQDARRVSTAHWSGHSVHAGA